MFYIDATQKIKKNYKINLSLCINCGMRIKIYFWNKIITRIRLEFFSR